MLLNKHLMLQYSTNLIQTYIEHTTFSQTYSMNDLLCLFSRNIRLLISETNLKFWNKDTSYIQKSIKSLSNNCLYSVMKVLLCVKIDLKIWMKQIIKPNKIYIVGVAHYFVKDSKAIKELQTRSCVIEKLHLYQDWSKIYNSIK